MTLQTEERIVLAGPNANALEDFENMLTDHVPEVQNRKLQKLHGKQLLQEDLSYAKCFVIMPRASRTLVYIDGDRSSMYQELQHICKGQSKDWKIERAFIILYRHKDLSKGLYDSDIRDWWDSGPQKELERFATNEHLVSLRETMNDDQVKAIRNFLRYEKQQVIFWQPTSTKCEETSKCLCSDDRLDRIVWPNQEAMQEFCSRHLTDVAPEAQNQNREPQVLLADQSLKSDLDFSNAKCFLVMPRASRTLVYIEGDRSTMYREIQHVLE